MVVVCQISKQIQVTGIPHMLVVVNTGGGADADPSPSTTGGKGIVIIRYPT